MTREESIAILDGFKHNPLFNEQHFEALDMAISALSKNKGEWIGLDSDTEKYDDIMCSNCKKHFTVDTYRWCDIGFTVDDLKFCPNCGADMRGE